MTDGAPEPDPRRWTALAVCISAMFLTLLDVSIVTVALPSIGRSLGANAAELQWVVSGYALAFGMVPIIGGRLGDDRGRKLMLLVGIASFVVFSLMVGVAPSPSVIIVARVLQGMAGGLLNPQVSGLVQQLFPLSERGKAFGALGGAVGIGTAAGPVVGGAIIALGGPEFGWRLCFLVNVPVGIVAFILCGKLLPSPPPREGNRPLDLPGVALLTLGVFGLLFPAVQFDANHDLRLAIIAVPALVVLAGFFAWERGPARRRGYPLVDLSLLRIRSFADGNVLALLFFSGFAGTQLVLALFLQDGLGFSALQSGLVASAYAIGSAVSAPIGGRLLGRLGQRLLVIAILLFALGIGGSALLAHALSGVAPAAHVALFMAPALLLAGIGGGSVITPNQALSLAEVDVRGGSTAGGMLQTSQRIGVAIGAAVISAVFWSGVSGAPGSGPARAATFGHAYTASLLVSVTFATLSLLVALRDVRHRQLTTPAAR